MNKRLLSVVSRYLGHSRFRVAYGAPALATYIAKIGTVGSRWEVQLYDLKHRCPRILWVSLYSKSSKVRELAVSKL